MVKNDWTRLLLREALREFFCRSSERSFLGRRPSLLLGGLGLRTFRIRHALSQVGGLPPPYLAFRPTTSPAFGLEGRSSLRSKVYRAFAERTRALRHQDPGHQTNPPAAPEPSANDLLLSLPPIAIGTVTQFTSSATSPYFRRQNLRVCVPSPLPPRYL
jgi:hypothetical protein